MLFVKANNLSGAFLWTIDLDDFDGKYCGEGRFPLLNAIKNELTQPNDYYDLYDSTNASSKLFITSFYYLELNLFLFLAYFTFYFSF